MQGNTGKSLLHLSVTSSNGDDAGVGMLPSSSSTCCSSICCSVIVVQLF